MRDAESFWFVAAHKPNEDMRKDSESEIIVEWKALQVRTFAMHTYMSSFRQQWQMAIGTHNLGLHELNPAMRTVLYCPCVPHPV